MSLVALINWLVSELTLAENGVLRFFILRYELDFLVNELLIFSLVQLSVYV
jgi:hypothetical protein